MPRRGVSLYPGRSSDFRIILLPAPSHPASVRQWLHTGFVPGYSGGTAPVFHRLPYYTLYGHPNIIVQNIYAMNPGCQVGKYPWRIIIQHLGFSPGSLGSMPMVGWGRRIRTSIGDSKGRCPAIGRSPSMRPARVGRFAAPICRNYNDYSPGHASILSGSAQGRSRLSHLPGGAPRENRVIAQRALRYRPFPLYYM
jgi:hypothetical protein